MGKLEDLISKRDLELEQERKAKVAEKERKEYENELAINERQRREAREKADSINHSESVGLGILYGIIGAFIGFLGGGLLGFVLWLIFVLFGMDHNNDTVIGIVGVLGLIIGGLGGFWMGFEERRNKLN
jgi:hypothetical protein